MSLASGLRTAGAAMVGAAIVVALTSCQIDAGAPPATPRDRDGSDITIYEDEARGVVCYILDGYETGADLSCLELAP